MHARIDRAKAADLPQLAALLNDLFSLEQDFVPDVLRQRRGIELLLERTGDAVVFTARDGEGAAIGMISVQRVISTAEGAYSAWIEDVVVDRLYRGKGIGRALIVAALDWARAHGATRAQLLADSDNADALAFYEKLGWQPTHLTARRVFLKSPQENGR